MLARKTDQLFAWLMVCQWVAGIAAALWISPRTWAGPYNQVHIHIYAAVILGGLITALPVLLAALSPGKTITRHVIAAGQMLTSALLIHLTGGRIETHFHVFGSLAFLAFYRDWRVLITASLVVGLDHILRESRGEVCAGAREFIAGLTALPQPPLLGLLTGNIRLGAEIKLRHFDLWDVFQTGAFADDHEERDQIAAIARDRAGRMLQRNLRGEEILVVGDTPLDIRCARAIGAKALAVASGGSTLAELKLHAPDWAVADLTGVRAGRLVS